MYVHAGRRSFGAMTAQVLEAVPNFSEGRDAGVIDAIVGVIERAGARVLDRTSDVDHHRSVVTLVGEPSVVEEAVLAAARVAVERIDMRKHRGVHPRIGALDVLPFVPLAGLEMADARASAHRVGTAIAEEIGVPVYYYGAASAPPGRALAELRGGGFETLAEGWPADRTPDLVPESWAWSGIHPSAGAVCVGARRVLLAWNVVVEGVDETAGARIARKIRERDGGFQGVRALALRLETRGVLQISMNLENPDATSPMSVFRTIEKMTAETGGRVVETEVIGMVPDQLVLSAAVDRLRLADTSGERLLSRAVMNHLTTQGEPLRGHSE